MNDPHVESLRYSLEVDETYGRFNNPPPVTYETDAYIMNLELEILTVEMKEHHVTVESARARIEPDLKAWELHAALERDHTWFKFVFDSKGTKIVQILPPGHVHAQMNAMLGNVTASFTGIVTPPSFNEYPKPPKAFEASPEVEVLFERYQKAIWLDESQLLSVGYVCLSFLQGTTGIKQGARKEVSRKYRIAEEVRNKLGDLVSEKGDIREARKLDAGATLVPLTPAERLWVRAAIKALIRRKGEYDHDPAAASALPEITMVDLPPL